MKEDTIKELNDEIRNIYEIFIPSFNRRLEKLEKRFSIFEGKKGSSDLLNLLALEHVHNMVKEKLKDC